ncbi:MAG: hypothetical protein JXB49_11355 [Bacteroidales bacterium]|nr:hypothetical protein [Bacteroidales bacterium]
MEEILITGLDGSGKSTLLAALEQHKGDNDFDIIYLPHIETASLELYSNLYNAAVFVNTLSKQADDSKSPALKALAIFASMLLYRPLVQSKNNTRVSTVFAERHPLVDTGVYAMFYAEKAAIEVLPREIISSLNAQFPDALFYLGRFIPDEIRQDKEPDISWFLQFIYQRFFKEGKTGIQDLGELFGKNLPSKIHYLKADPEALIERITHRNRLEAHENLEVLIELSHGYDKILKILETKGVIVDTIDANDFENLNTFKEYLLKKYC